MSTIKAKALQLEADLAAGGTPNAFPSVPVTCFLEWDLVQQMHPMPPMHLSLQRQSHGPRAHVAKCCAPSIGSAEGHHHRRGYA